VANRRKCKNGAVLYICICTLGDPIREYPHPPVDGKKRRSIADSAAPAITLSIVLAVVDSRAELDPWSTTWRSGFASTTKALPWQPS
jgi:hypothetical protein